MPVPLVGMFYQAVMTAVLLYCSELWVLISLGLHILEGFYVEGVCCMIGMCPQYQTSGPWVYVKPKNLLATTRLKPFATYIPWYRHNMVKILKDQTLLEECSEVERRLGSPPLQFWWEQEMHLEEEDEGEAAGGVRGTHLFYKKVGHMVDVGIWRPPRTPYGPLQHGP